MTLDLVIRGQDDNGETIEIFFSVPEHSSPQFVFRKAIVLLWGERWTPGSVEWQVYSVLPRPLADEATGIGENFSGPRLGCRYR